MLLFLPQRLFQSVSIWFVDFVGDVFADPGATLVQLEWCILLRHLLHANQYLHGDSDGLLQTNEYKWAGLYAAKTTGPPHWMQAARSRVTAGLKWLFLAVALGFLGRLFCVRRIRFRFWFRGVSRCASLAGSIHRGSVAGSIGVGVGRAVDVRAIATSVDAGRARGLNSRPCIGRLRLIDCFVSLVLGFRDRLLGRVLGFVGRLLCLFLGVVSGLLGCVGHPVGGLVQTIRICTCGCVNG